MKLVRDFICLITTNYWRQIKKAIFCLHKGFNANTALPLLNTFHIFKENDNVFTTIHLTGLISWPIQHVGRLWQLTSEAPNPRIMESRGGVQSMLLSSFFILNCAYFHFRILYHGPISYSKHGFQMFPLNATRQHWGHDLLILMSKIWSMKWNEGQRQSWHKANVFKSIYWTLQTLSIRQRKNKKNACNKLSISCSPIAYLLIHIHPQFMFHISTAQSCSFARCKCRNWVKSPQHRTCN